MREHADKSLQNKINWLCAIVFAIFSFTFIGVYQASLLEALYDVVATGKLKYNGYVVATIVTAVLVFVALWLNRYAKFRFEWTALAYLPSSLLLAFITDIDSSIYSGENSFVMWSIILFTGVMAYTVIAYVLRGMCIYNRRYKPQLRTKIVWRNFLILTILFCLTGLLSNSDENFKNETQAYSFYKKGDIDAALNVANRSLNASHELTSSRAFYLALNNELPNQLFAYPQYYGVEGLLPPQKQMTPLHPDTVYTFLGAQRMQDEAALDYLRRAVKNDTLPSAALVDYYLCGLLLDKRVSEFVEELPLYYDLQSENPLPRHYKEALLYYVTAVDELDLPFETDSMRAEYMKMSIMDWKDIGDLPAHYKEVLTKYAFAADGIETLVDADSLGKEFVTMLEMEKQYPELHIRTNYIRKKYGNTYWWYFGYSE